MNDAGEQNSQTWRIAAGLVLVIAAAAALWWYLQRPKTEVLPQVSAPTAAPEAAGAAEPQIRHPLEPAAAGEAVSAEPAAPVDPDAAVHQGLDEVFGAPAITPWLIPEHLVRRLVATTDNLARDTRTESLRPLRAPGGAVTVEREVLDAATGTERITLSAENSRRYDTVVGLLARADMSAAAQVYRRLYPLLQRGYEDLGYPGRYFNDRVVEVIDHLLATPEPAGPLLLEQPKVLYRFADADLESRSAGQKLLLRLGVEHARTVKQQLREFRKQIASKE